MLYALGAALFIAAYTTTDGLGARLAESPHSYIAWLFVLDGFPIGVITLGLRGRGALDWIRNHWVRGTAGGAMSVVGYWLIRLGAEYRRPGPGGGASRGWCHFRGHLGVSRAQRALRAPPDGGGLRCRCGRDAAAREPDLLFSPRGEAPGCERTQEAQGAPGAPGPTTGASLPINPPRLFPHQTPHGSQAAFELVAHRDELVLVRR